MKKFFVCAAALCLVLMLCGFDFDDTVEKQLAAAERGGVSDALPESAAEILKSLGVEEMSAQSLSEISFGDAVRLVGESIKERIRAPFLSVISVCAAGILCSVINNFGSGEMKTVYSAVCTLAAAAAVIIPVKNVLSSGARVITECSDFMLGFIPVYSSVIAASGGVSPDDARAIARSEVCCPLDDLCMCASYLLRFGGDFFFVHRPERLCDLLCTLRAHGLEAKRMRLVRHHAGADASLVLIAARRGGRPGLKIEPELLLTAPDGTESAEYRRIYHR